LIYQPERLYYFNPGHRPGVKTSLNPLMQFEKLAVMS
jgi:hypothetical protein